jgi:hypothetical protein
MGIYGNIGLIRQTPPTTLALSSCQTIRMTGNRLLPNSPTLEWYLGVVVFDVVRGERVLD